MENFILLEMIATLVLFLIVCAIILDFELKEIKKCNLDKEKISEEKEQKKLERDNRKQKREGG